MKLTTKVIEQLGFSKIQTGSYILTTSSGHYLRLQH